MPIDPGVALGPGKFRNGKHTPKKAFAALAAGFAEY
jgi:hypothetical protein